jgi:UDP-2,3-diacylglucosamine hydrolase
MHTGPIYFLSDFHLGIPDPARSLARERRVVCFLEEAAKDAQEIHLLGDLFDFWFEWRSVVPRGHVRLLGALARLCDRGIPVHLYLGNHDMWVANYLPKEVGLVVHEGNCTREWGGKRFLIGHGDGLGPGDHGYKIMKRFFRNPICQWLFARAHPNLSIGLAHFWSAKSRKKNYANDRKFLGAEKELLAQYCRAYLQQQHVDHFVFGHRHLPMRLVLGENSAYTNLGDWITHFTYAVFDGVELRLMQRTGDGELAQDRPAPDLPPR